MSAVKREVKTISAEDRSILRELAKRVAEVAAEPVQAERIKLWTRHNSLQSCRPLILIFPEGAWQELLPQRGLTCQGRVAKSMEQDLRTRLYYHDHLVDDTVITNTYEVPKVIHHTGWGLEPKRIASTTASGAWHVDPVIKDPDDLKALKIPTVSEDRLASDDALSSTQELFGDILDVKQVGITHISYHLMAQVTRLRGLEEVMMDMYTNPEMLHEAMAIFEAGHHAILAQYQELNLLSLNNNNTYQNSGGNSWTDELPAEGFCSECVRPIDLWASAEAQEMAQVSPVHHAEFVLPYEKRLLEPFGLTGYGCCEPLHDRLDYVLPLPRLRRLSISPWTDVRIAAERLRGDYIFSWKPNPVMLVGAFHEERIRDTLRSTVDLCAENGCHLEIILKDTHTCENHPERFERWLAIAQEVVGR